ncbi:phosphatidylglycerophosphatase A [Moraxella atlantae]|uniref:phosphatidylglycerophosphatase A family protein n=1 Tax=Faucicola atlantae TaxID=34059 RepID=UPI0037530C2B
MTMHKPDVRKANPCPPCPPDASGWERLIYWLGIGLGSGLPKRAAGTWGTVGGLLVGIGLSWLGFWGFLAITVAGGLVGSYICGKTSDLMGVHDDPHIVFDEWVGMWITLLALKYCYQFDPLNNMSHYRIDTWFGMWQWGHLLMAFVLFRFFDIIKPFPIKWVDRHVDGGFGILIDDVLAGVMAAIVFIGLMFIII